jgi:hypothetical protein
MQTMQDVIADHAKRSTLIEDCVRLIDDEVQNKSGLTGIAVKTAYKVVKGLKPGFISDAVDGLIDDFSARLQPIATEAQEKDTSVSAYFVEHRSRVADALLGITDKRAERSTHKVVKGSYSKLRPTAKKHVEEAVPGVGKLVEKYVRG